MHTLAHHWLCMATACTAHSNPHVKPTLQHHLPLSSHLSIAGCCWVHACQYAADVGAVSLAALAALAGGLNVAHNFTYALQHSGICSSGDKVLRGHHTRQAAAAQGGAGTHAQYGAAAYVHDRRTCTPECVEATNTGVVACVHFLGAMCSANTRLQDASVRRCCS